MKKVYGYDCFVGSIMVEFVCGMFYYIVIYYFILLKVIGKIKYCDLFF